jgi:hypothetical protein
MVTSHEAVAQIVQIMLQHVEIKVARKMVRHLYHDVKGNQSIMQTLLRVAQLLEELNHEQ